MIGLGADKNWDILGIFPKKGEGEGGNLFLDKIVNFAGPKK